MIFLLIFIGACWYAGNAVMKRTNSSTIGWIVGILMFAAVQGMLGTRFLGTAAACFVAFTISAVCEM